MLKPRSLRRRVRSWATSSSSPDGLSIRTRSQNVFIKRSCFIMNVLAGSGRRDYTRKHAGRDSQPGETATRYFTASASA